MEAPRCQTCGQENPVDAEFCVNRSCGAFLGWQSARAAAPPMPPVAPPSHIAVPPQPPAYRPPQAPTAQVPSAPAPRPRPTNPGAPTQRVLARLETDHARVEPGGKCDLSMVVRNGGTVVEQFVISVGGVPASWVSIDPPQVNLDVDSEQRVLITIRPPRVSTTPAGRTPISVTITSSVDHSVIAALQGAVDIDGFTVLNSTLSPFESESKKEGEHQLIVSNDGNVPANVNFTGADPADKLKISFDPPYAGLQPAQQAFVRVVAAPRRRLWFATPKRHQFSVSVTPPNGVPTQLNASNNQLALFPHWVPKVAIAALVVLLAVGVPFTIRELNKQDQESAANAIIPVPQVTGLTFDQAATQLLTKGFVAERAPEAVSEGEKDKVFSQEPAANTQARKQSVVKLTMSAGPGRTAIADVQAFSPEDSKKTLEALKLTVSTAAQKVQNRDIAEGLVVRTNPPAATQVDVGSSVELVLSDGPPPKPLPPLTGEYTEVSKDLVSAGFAVLSPPKSAKTQDDKLKGTVSGCTVTDDNRPCAPREKEGITVQLSVFVMDQVTGVPDILKLDQVAAAKKLTESGLVVGSITKRPSSTASIGTVTAVNPAVGAKANLGSVIALTVSGGPPVTVPNLSGMTILAAKSRLTSLGLGGGSAVCKDTESVSTQSPAANTLASKGDAVNLGCSRCSLSFCVDVKSVLLNEAFLLKTN
ncbi:MAG TPA: PASTA domain-containing protein [Acidimicrobiales bacterium]|nr:PASTA domain-containing protein [Acidimicrobiales bacterium]